MNIIKSKDICNIIRDILNRVDERLVNHGERLAYIVANMLEVKGGYSQKQINIAIILAMVHDIGAYKTEEVDKMMEFELDTIWEHSVYGYLYLKYLSPFSQYADVVLYHHLDFNRFDKVQSENKELAQIFKLADRIDIHVKSVGKVDYNLIDKYADIKFSKDIIDLFKQTDKERNIVKNLVGGNYQLYLKRRMELAHFSKHQKIHFLRMITYSIDFRSEFTINHTVITGCLSRVIAENLNLGRKNILKIYYGSMLHDIGKISTPLKILEKPGSLTPDEMNIMKSHVVATYEILSKYISKDIKNIAVRHHEKLDGSGYPFGLTEKELSQSEKIVIVADIVSALLGKRSYKDPFSKDKIFGILNSLKNNHKICPIITDFVIDNFDKLIEECNEKSDEILKTYSNVKGEFTQIMKIINDTI